MNEILLFPIDMPLAAKGQVLPLPEGDYAVMINSRYNAQQQRQTYNHEITHLLQGHYQDTRPISAIEEEANAEAKGALLEKIKDAERNGLSLNTAIFPPGQEQPEEPLPVQLPLDCPAPWLLGVADALADIRHHWDALMAESEPAPARARITGITRRYCEPADPWEID